MNANGPLYGSPEYSTDNMPILDPKTNKVSFFKMPVADPDMPVSLGPGHAGAVKPTAAVGLLGRAKSCGTRAPTITIRCSTSKGRVWLAATVRGMDNPAWCKKGSDNPYAKVFPIEKSPRQVGDARSEDDEIRIHRHLLRHASSAVRLRRRQHVVDVRHRPGGRLDQHQSVG